MAATWLPFRHWGTELSSALPLRLYGEQDAIHGAIGGQFIQGHPSLSLVKALPRTCVLERASSLLTAVPSLRFTLLYSLMPSGAQEWEELRTGSGV